MSLVTSLLTAIVRADGDALVLHAGERPYVVAPSGQFELASRVLTLEAMTGMLGELLPQDARRALDEIGAVQHDLRRGLHGERFTVVAARGGSDIWIEIRRHRGETDAEAPAPAAVPAPPESAPAPAPVMSEPEPEARPVVAHVRAVEVQAVDEPEPVELRPAVVLPLARSQVRCGADGAILAAAARGRASIGCCASPPRAARRRCT